MSKFANRPNHVFASQAKLLQVVHKLTFVNRKKDNEAFCLSIPKYLSEVEKKADWKQNGKEIINSQGRVMAVIEDRRMSRKTIKALRLV